MRITCYLVDDEQHAVDLLSVYIHKTPGLELAGASTNPLTAIAEINNIVPAVIFLDVDMPDINGIRFAELVSGPSEIIFTTAFSEYAVQAFDKEAVDYLLKPISYERFLKTIQKINRRLSLLQGERTKIHNFIFVKTGVKGRMIKIDVSEILFIAAALNYIEIHLNEQRIITYLSLEEIMHELPENSFSRIHRSYIVQHKQILFLEPNQIKLNNATILPVGRAYREEFRNKLKHSFLISNRDQPE